MKEKEVGFLYLLHLSRPYRHARHYMGWAKDLDRRLEEHRNGTGARLTQVAVQNGIELILAWASRGTRDDERWMKNKKNAPRLCPLCRELSKVS